MEPYMWLGIVTAGATGLTIGLLAGWYACAEHIRKENKKMAEAMMASVGARRSQRQPEDMMQYQNRQRTTAENNGKKARQAVVRPRRVFRRPARRD